MIKEQSRTWSADTGASGTALHVASVKGKETTLEVALQGQNGVYEIRAEGSAHGISIAPTRIEIKDGHAKATFVLQGLPPTVAYLPDVELVWRGDGLTEWTSKHTFYVVDAEPLNVYGNALREVFEWSCRWAAGKEGPAEVAAAIWSEIQSMEATGFVYHEHGKSPNGDVANALSARAASGNRSANCTFFASLLASCLGVQGIPTIVATLTAKQPYRGWWAPDGSRAQGQSASETDRGPWSTHSVVIAQVAGSHVFYDPSYGIGPIPVPADRVPRSALDRIYLPPEVEASLVGSYSDKSGKEEPWSPDGDSVLLWSIGQKYGTFQ